MLARLTPKRPGRPARLPFPACALAAGGPTLPRHRAHDPGTGGTAMRMLLLAGVAMLGSLAPQAAAQVTISANDAKVMLRNGAVVPVPNAPPDSITIMDVANDQVRVRG